MVMGSNGAVIDQGATDTSGTREGDPAGEAVAGGDDDINLVVIIDSCSLLPNVCLHLYLSFTL